MPAPDHVWELEHGLCVGVTLPVEGAQGVLVDEEAAHAASLGEIRRRSWVGGRVALRLAARRLGVDLPPVLADDRGAPRLPPGTLASISHKDGLAVALMAQGASAPDGRIGVDVEDDRPGKLDISRKILRPEELATLDGVPDAARSREVLLRFSAKEAVYKALDPYVRRYVGFTEVALSMRPDGTASVEAFLVDGEGPFDFDVRWRREGGLIVTTARVRPRRA